MKRSLTSHSSTSDLAQAFRFSNLSLRSRLNILPVRGEGGLSRRDKKLGHHLSLFLGPQSSFYYCLSTMQHRVTANLLKRCLCMSTRTITKLESEAAMRKGQTLIMAGPWHDRV